MAPWGCHADCWIVLKMGCAQLSWPARITSPWPTWRPRCLPDQRTAFFALFSRWAYSDNGRQRSGPLRWIDLAPRPSPHGACSDGRASSLDYGQGLDFNDWDGHSLNDSSQRWGRTPSSLASASKRISSSRPVSHTTQEALPGELHCWQGLGAISIRIVWDACKSNGKTNWESVLPSQKTQTSTKILIKPIARSTRH